MKNVIQKILFFLVSVILTFFIYWLVFLDKESKNDALNYSISFLGERLLSMIPDSLGKSSIASLYSNFSQKVNQREIPQDQVEIVAANILNLTTLDTVLTPAEAAAALNFSSTDSNRKIVILDIDKGSQPIREPGIVVRNSSSEPEWKNLGLKLKEMCQVSQEISDVLRENNETVRTNVVTPIFFQVNEQIRAIVDSSFLGKIEATRDEKLLVKLKKLEQANLLIWVPELKDNLADVQTGLIELKKVHQYTQSDSFKTLVKGQVQASLDILKKLQGMGLTDIKIDVDSLKKAALKSVAASDSNKSN